MTEKDISIDKVEETMKRADERLDLMEVKVETLERELSSEIQDVNIFTLLQSVSEVRSDYQQLRRELMEVQALQRELSTRLRSQLRQVHNKFARLRERIALAASPTR